MIQFLADACTGQGFLPDLFNGLRNSDCSVNITSFGDITHLLINFLSALLSFAGVIAAVFVIIGAFFYITSNGEPAGIKRGKDTVVNALLGLGITLVALGIINFIGSRF
jgi:hypothetical protein